MSTGRNLGALNVGLAILAVLNLSAGVWLALHGQAASDLQQVTVWAADWLRGGNPYAAIDASVDYPPWALVTLSPLALTSPALRIPLWIGLNLALVVALARRLAWHAGEPAAVRVALMLLLSSTAAAHTLTQFSLLSYALAVAGALSPSRAGGAVAVGLALMKPQIGGIVLIWWLLSRQWTKTALALLVPAVLTMVFAFRSGVDAGTLLTQYARILPIVHGAADSLGGHTELRRWFIEGWPGAGTLAFAAVLGAVLLLPAIVASARRLSWTADEMLEWLGLCGAASLLVVRHLSYDFIVLWPVLIAWRTGPFSAGPRRYAATAAFWMLASALVIGVPGWIRAAVMVGAPPAILVLTEMDRIVALGAWGYLGWRVITRRSGVNYW